jgi:predicted TIM-barrel fold metal-dependent hydrolase
MNIQTIESSSAKAKGEGRLAIADCDIHPARRSPKDLYPFLEKRWHEHLETFGSIQRMGSETAHAYPKGQPSAARRDAFPPTGFRPGSDLPFLREQLLDGYGIEFGVLNPVGDNGQSAQNQDFGAAYCAAINHWQLEVWAKQEPRLKASIVVPYDNTAAAVKEIEKWAGNPHFVQVLFQSRSSEPFGQRRYWPIYDAACAAGLPIGIHAFGFSGYAITGGGWPSYYIEDMVGHAQSCMALLNSMVIEGVFERNPTLKVVLIEGGFGWLPSLAWRLDKTWKTLKQETPHLKRLPSEYICDHLWLTTQPMEEPEDKQHLIDVIDWIGWDKLLFASDYPHWDFDDPTLALSVKVSDEKRRAFFFNNAMKLYGQI